MWILSGQKAETALRKVERRGTTSLAAVEIPVRRIVEDVRNQGDRALRRHAAKWDGLTSRQTLRVPPLELKQAWESTSEEFRNAVRTAAENIRRYCELQRPREWQRSLQPGIEVGQVVRPLESVGCYVPGGRYPLPSTMLMTVIPAQVAGVKEIRVVSPRPAAATLGAAFFLGIKEFYRVGGAQAIAALAYGTKTIPKVNKIVGPGNLYVTAAKKIVAFDCAIDFLAGPTEIVVVSHAGEPRFIAADLVAQAEHDPDAVPLFITTSKELAESVKQEVAKATQENEIAADSVARNGLILLAASREQAMEFANRIAPEHITVEEADLPLVMNAGSIFIGDYSPQAGGDYAVGPNHVLPTGAVARFRGGLCTADFLKVISTQQLTNQGLQQLASAIITLAEAEGLKAHAESVRVRCAHA
jgi:histidinol dehydrogenase